MKNSVIPMGGTLRATFVLGVAVLLCIFAVFTVRANVLVYEGFSSTDYQKDVSINENKSNGYSIGLDTTDGWNSGTGVYSAKETGLSLPSSWSSCGTVRGTTAGGCVLQGTGTDANTQRRRAQYRALGCDWPTFGSVYFRFLMRVPKDCLSTSYLKDWGFWLGGLGTAKVASPTSDNCTLSAGIYMGVVNSNGVLKIIGYVKNPADNGITSRYLGTVDTSKQLDYACVAKIDIGTGGNDTVSLYAAPVSEWDDYFQWSEPISGMSFVSGTTKLSYLEMIGQYKTNNKPITFDEFIVTSNESEAYYHAASYLPTIGAVSFAHTGPASYSVSVEETANPADHIYWIADDGSSTPATNLIQSAVAAGATVNDSTPSVHLV